MNKILLFLTAALCFFVYPASAQKKTQIRNLRVLYVGGSANWEKEVFKSEEERNKDVERRTASFVSMLKKYFTTVDAVDAKAYSQAISYRYDVTIIDGVPKPLAPRSMVKDSSGRVVRYIPASYLTEDFDQPVLFIGETGETLGRSIGLKLDWYCLCLDAHAHNFKKEHPIFKGPFPVKMTIEERPTPEDAFHYEYFLGHKTPETLPMWRVQTKGYQSDKGFRIGMVARPWGFEDSPDAESISSGVCAKTLDAVALGRHGNFFHWGFAASPEFMTDEAHAVLANAVVYISGFKGKGVIARKYLDRRATREYLKERKYYATREVYESRRKRNQDFDEQMMAKKAVAEAKKAKGEQLTPSDSMSLNYKPQPQQSFEEFLQRYHKDLYHKFGTNTEAYLKYYDENKDYFYSHDASYEISVDEDVKSLQIPYYDKRLLEKCIAMLEKGEDTEKARRILDRYTLADFNTPAEWRAWYEKYKNQMFFTETGGYYFMINTYDKNVEGNDYKKKALKKSYSRITTGETDDITPVRVATGVISLDGNRKEIVVKFRIHPGYHIYASVSEKDPFIGTVVEVQVPRGYSKVGELKMPSFNYYNESGTTIYTDEVMFVQEISGQGEGTAECFVTYQCCDAHICFPPVERMKVEAKL